MPRKTMTREEAFEAIEAVLPADGSDMPALEFRAALESAGKAEAINHLRALKDSGQIVGYVRLNPDKSVSHMYRRGE